MFFLLLHLFWSLSGHACTEYMLFSINVFCIITTVHLPAAALFSLVQTLMILNTQVDHSTILCNLSLWVYRCRSIIKCPLKFKLYSPLDFSSSFSVLKWRVGIRRFSLSSEMPKNRQSRRKPKATIRRAQPRLRWCSPARCAGWVSRSCHSLNQGTEMAFCSHFMSKFCCRWLVWNVLLCWEIGRHVPQ